MKSLRSGTRLLTAVPVAAALWFYMFSPWTAGLTSFWVTMAFSALILTSIAIALDGGLPARLTLSRKDIVQIPIGIAIAFVLWGIFWTGDKLSSMMFSFARPEVDAVYSMKDGSNPVVIALLLLFLIGPAEEIFWRGFVQHNFIRVFDRWKSPADMAFVVTAAIYALVHIWSFNFMLVMAALVAGGVWGLIYRFRPGLLPALVVSHAVWDALVFVILPI